MRSYLAATLLLSCAALVAQDIRPKDVREIGKGGVSSIPRLQELLQNPNREIRVEAVKQLTAIGTQHSLDPLIAATKDADPDVQMRATDGLVNFYLPGYVQTGIGGSLKRVGTGLKGHFTDTDDQVIPAYVIVRPEVVAALGALAKGDASTDARAEACRALGILRGRTAIPDLIEAAHSKNSDVIFESLIALQKIRDESVGPKIEFLFHDLDSRVQGTALETAGLLRDMTAVPSICGCAQPGARYQGEALRPDRPRHAARRYQPASLPAVSARQGRKTARRRRRGLRPPAQSRRSPHARKSLAGRDENPPRLSLAFAQVMLGKTEISEFSPLQYLINNLDSASYKGEAVPFLVELARNAQVRQALYPTLASGTKDEKIGLAGVLARSGDQASLAPLQKLTNDPDGDVSKEALRAVRVLQARLPG